MLRGEKKLSENNAAYVKYIHSSGQQLLEVITDAMFIAGLEMRALPVTVNPIDMARLIRYCANWLKTAEIPLKVRLQVVRIGERYAVLGDENALREMFCRLIANIARSGDEERLVRVVLSARQGDGLKIVVSNLKEAAVDERVYRELKPIEIKDATIAQDLGSNYLSWILISKIVGLHEGILKMIRSVGNGMVVAVEFPNGRVATLEPTNTNV